MKRRKAYEKPSERKTREKAEAVRRARKAARKQAPRSPPGARTYKERPPREGSAGGPRCNEILEKPGGNRVRVPPPRVHSSADGVKPGAERAPAALRRAKHLKLADNSATPDTAYRGERPPNAGDAAPDRGEW
jgi:hypothetical protein